MKEERFTVWVGGGEVNSHYVSKEEANNIAECWRAKGYDDVCVEKVSEL